MDVDGFNLYKWLVSVRRANTMSFFGKDQYWWYLKNIYYLTVQDLDEYTNNTKCLSEESFLLEITFTNITKLSTFYEYYHKRSEINLKDK